MVAVGVGVGVAVGVGVVVVVVAGVSAMKSNQLIEAAKRLHLYCAGRETIDVMAPPLLEVRRLAGATPEASTQDDWQPVPPSEGEVMPEQRAAKRQGKAEYGDAYTPPEMEIAADDPRFQLAKPPHREPSIDADQKLSEGEVAAGPYITVRQILQSLLRGDITSDDAEVQISRNFEARHAATNPTPEGHVAVYLPVEVAEEITDPIVAANLEMEIQNATALFKACREALSNGEGV